MPQAHSAQTDDISGKLVLAGSGSNLEITRTLAKAFMLGRPSLRIDIPSSIGSKGGIRAVADGNINVGLASRPLKEEEQNLGLAVKPYARTAVVFGVHPTVEESSVGRDDLLAIFKGERSRWRNRQEIIVLIREPGDSSILSLEQKLTGFTPVYAEAWKNRRWVALFTDQKMNRMLASTPHAIGITDIGSITAGRWGIKPLKFEGVYPTAKNIGNRTYPLTKVLAFVYKPNDLSPAAETFMAYVQSEAGTKILKLNGYAPAE